MDYLDDPLIFAVVERIKEDLLEGDETAIYELLSFTPKKHLMAYLPFEGQELVLQQQQNPLR